jgi:hypothetical protein
MGYPNRVIRSATHTTQRGVTVRNARDISPLTIWVAQNIAPDSILKKVPK